MVMHDLPTPPPPTTTSLYRFLVSRDRAVKQSLDLLAQKLGCHCVVLVLGPKGGRKRGGG